jgi:hypothetical protein
MDINELIQSCFKQAPQSSPQDAKKAIDSAEWIKNVIGSCFTKFHFECASRMIDLYKERFGKTELFEDLTIEYKAQLVKIHSI